MFTLLAFALIVASCGDDDDSDDASNPSETNNTSESSQDDRTVIVASATEPQTLDMQLVDLEWADIITFSINEQLLSLSPDGDLEPILAAELPTMSDDGLRWRMELREGVEFTNGEPFNAEAVKANVERITDPDYGSALIGIIPPGLTAEVVDEYTVEFVTETPDPILDRRLLVLRILPPEASQDPRYGDNPVGTGPYQFVEWQKGQHMIAEKNPDYWGGGDAVVERIEVRFIPDGSTRLSALLAGEVDMITSLAPDLASQAPQVLRGTRAATVGAVRLKVFEPPYDDVRFRQALNYAIDKEGLNEGLFDGEYKLQACQIVPEGATGFNPDLEPYPYDPERARELLAEVDIPEGFRLEFHGGSGIWTKDVEQQEAMAAMWQDVGLDVELVVHGEQSAYTAQAIAGGMGSEGGNPEAPPVFHAQTKNELNHAGRNVPRWLDRDNVLSTLGQEYPELDELISTASSSLDADEREAAYHEVAEIMCDEALWVYTLETIDLWGASERIDYEPTDAVVHRIHWEEVGLR